MKHNDAPEDPAQLSDYVGVPQQEQPDESGETIEERCFSAALVCLEGHYTQSPPMGPQTAARVTSMISKTLEKTHTLRKTRYALTRLMLHFISLLSRRKY
jgi:palmitoyltransferase